MKKRLYSLTIIFTICILLLVIFTESNKLNSTVLFSIKLFINNIFPSLFPMFIISSILVEIDIPKVLGNIFKKPMNYLFKSKGESSFVFFMSMLTGFPSSAKYLDDLMDKKLITKKDSEKILMFTFFSNPLFIVNTVGYTFLNSSYYGFILLICHILGNIVIGFLFRNFNKSAIISDNKNIYNNLKYLNDKINDTNIFKVLFKSIKNSIDILMNIFGIITFFLIIINLLFKNTDSLLSIFIIGTMEMTTGLKYLSLTEFDISLKLLLSCLFLSFGGFSIHFQIMSILTKRKVKYLPFLVSRILHAIISSVILMLLLQVDMLF